MWPGILARFSTVSTDPFRALGLSRGQADADAVRRARRRLARENHPDIGGDLDAMRAVNAAATAALAELDAASSTGGAERTQRRANAPMSSSGPDGGHSSTQRGATTPGGATGGDDHAGPKDHVAATRVDRCSFTIEVLPVDAHEVLCVAASWVGEIVDDDPPYLLDVDMHDPLRAWCRLELVPDAGATTVSLAVSATYGADGLLVPTPHVDEVRDVWVDVINRLVVDDPPLLS